MRAIVCVAIITIHGCQAPARPLGIPAEHRDAIENQVFTPVARIGDLPVSVRDAVRQLPGGNPRLADNTTVATAGHDLILLGCAVDHCIVHYEHRGVFYLALLGMATRVLVEWQAFVPEPLGDLEAALAVVLGHPPKVP